MKWVEFITLLSIVQVFGFGILVGRVRRIYGVASPKMSGHDVVERYIRIQQNTFELLIMLLPSLWICARYIMPEIAAGLGAIYIFGRILYLRGYSKSPSKRHLGFGVSIAPIFILIAVSFWKMITT